MKRFAEGTVTPVEKSQAEIHRLLRRYGATEFSSGWHHGGAAISFVFKARRVSFNVPHPTAKDIPSGTRNGAAWIEGEERRRWRCLVLGIKAKLEFVAQGIATFEEEFLSHIVTPNGQTVYERLTSSAETKLKLLGPATNEGS
jgi:hypothetical protein